MDEPKKWRWRRGLLLLAATIALGVYLLSRMYVSESQLAKLTRGMSDSEVVAIMGNSGKMTHIGRGAESTDYWEYRTFDGPVTLVFNDGKYSDLLRSPIPKP